MKAKFLIILLIILLTSCTSIDSPKEDIVETEVIIKENKSIIIEEKRCNDGTLYNECSSQKPYYCQEGNIIKKASICDCPKNQIFEGENCVSRFEINSINRKFQYTLNGRLNEIELVTYQELNDYLSDLPRHYYCNPTCPSIQELELNYIDQSEQEFYLKKLATIIKKETSNKEDQARIAISLVQHIPYAFNEYRKNDLTGRYPYEILYDNQGVCGEKSKLLVFLLREFGFGTALFRYDAEKHMTAGIKCDPLYDYKDTGYCFIETTEPMIMTYEFSEYIDIGRLTSEPEVIPMNEGNVFDAEEEYSDAQEWKKIDELQSKILEAEVYDRWRSLVTKYGITFNKKTFFQ